jgi:hypothetical protein
MRVAVMRSRRARPWSCPRIETSNQAILGDLFVGHGLGRARGLKQSIEQRLPAQLEASGTALVVPED